MQPLELGKRKDEPLLGTRQRMQRGVQGSKLSTCLIKSSMDFLMLGDDIPYMAPARPKVWSKLSQIICCDIPPAAQETIFYDHLKILLYISIFSIWIKEICNACLCNNHFMSVRFEGIIILKNKLKIFLHKFRRN